MIQANPPIIRNYNEIFSPYCFWILILTKEEALDEVFWTMLFYLFNILSHEDFSPQRLRLLKDLLPKFWWHCDVTIPGLWSSMPPFFLRMQVFSQLTKGKFPFYFLQCHSTKTSVLCPVSYKFVEAGRLFECCLDRLNKGNSMCVFCSSHLASLWLFLLITE